MESILILTIAFPVILLCGILLAALFFRWGWKVGKVEATTELLKGMPSLKSVEQQKDELRGVPGPDPKPKKDEYDKENIGVLEAGPNAPE